MLLTGMKFQNVTLQRNNNSYVERQLTFLAVFLFYRIKASSLLKNNPYHKGELLWRKNLSS